MKNNKEIPRERKTAARGRTPIDTYPPKVEPAIVSNRVITDSPVREKEMAPPPTKEEAQAANAGKGLSKTENAILGFAKKHPVITVGSTLAAIAGGFAAIEAAQGNIPGIHRSVDIPQSFDKNATKGVVGPNNILVVSREEFNKTPSADAEGNPIFDFPWDKNYPMEIRYKADAIGDSAIAEAKANGMPNAEDYKGYKPQINADNPLPAGYEFPTIYPGRLFFMGSVIDEEASRKSPSNPYGLAVYNGPITMAKIEFIAPNGVLYFVNIEIIDDSGGREKQLPILPLIAAPLIGPGNGYGKDWEKGTLVEDFQKIFRTTKKGKLKMIINGGKNGSLLLPKDRVPGDFKFKTGIDAAGTTKILVSDSK